MAPPRKEMKQGRRQCRLGEDTNLLQAGGLARETSFEDLSNSPVPKSPLSQSMERAKVRWSGVMSANYKH